MIWRRVNVIITCLYAVGCSSGEDVGEFRELVKHPLSLRPAFARVGVFRVFERTFENGFTNEYLCP